jgi:hypothetical protein
MTMSPIARRAGLDDLVRFNPQQPRHPAGSSKGGQFSSGGGGGVSHLQMDRSVLPQAVEEAYLRAGLPRPEAGPLDCKNAEVRQEAKRIAAQAVEAGMSDVSTRALADDYIDHAPYWTGYSPGQASFQHEHNMAELLVNQALIQTESEPGGADLFTSDRRYVRLVDGRLQVASIGNISVDASSGASARPAREWDALAEQVGWAPAGSSAAERMVRLACVGDLIRQWAASSNDSSARSLAIQRAVVDEFGLRADGYSGWRREKGELAEQVAALTRSHGDVYRSFVRAQYDATQRLLAEAGITEMTLVRGTTNEDRWSLRDPFPQQFQVHERIPGDVISSTFSMTDATIRTRPISSWSTSLRTAYDFTGSGTMIVSRVPADRIFSTPVTGVGCLAETEIVVLATPDLEGRIAESDSGFHPLAKDYAKAFSSYAQIDVKRGRVEGSRPIVEPDIDDDHADWITVLVERDGEVSDRQMAESGDVRSATEGGEEREEPAVIRAFPLACPHRAALLDRALHGDVVAIQTVLTGTSRVVALRRREAEGETTIRFNPQQPRHPSGSSKGGQFASGASGASEASGEGGGGHRAPEGFTVIEDTQMCYRISGGHMGLGVVVEVDVIGNPMLTMHDEPQRRAVMHEMVDRTASIVAPLDEAYPSNLKLTVSIVPSADMAEMTGESMKNAPGGLTMGNRIFLNQAIFYTPKIASEGKIVGAATKNIRDGAKGVSYEAYQYGTRAGPGKFHPQIYRADPVRAIVTHEYGHVVDNRAQNRAIYRQDTHESVVGNHHTGIRIWGLSPEDYRSLPGYAKQSSTELYAEAFAEWHMRDVVEPSAGAVAMANLAHWVGSKEPPPLLTLEELGESA